MNKFKLSLIWGFLSIGLLACGGGSSTKEVEHKSGRYISSELLATYSNNDIDILDLDTKYPVKVYRVVYETKNIDGQFIDASGIVTIPQKSAQDKSPTLMFHHGTTYENRFVPSEFVHNASSWVLPGYLGFIVVAPDYIGYGESKDVLHPYLNADVTASSSIDLLRASKEILAKQNISSNNQLFLGGYSQGGSATLSTQKKIQEEFSNEFTVTASSAGAGAYALSKNLLESSQEILNDYESFIILRPNNLGLIFKAMDAGYGLNMLSKIFKPEYVDTVNTIYDGTHNSDFINSNLNKQASQLLQKSFLEDVVNGNAEELVNAFKDNDLLDWKPEAPTQLYHGRDDDWVVFSHAQTALDNMIANGATDIELVECEVVDNKPTNHANCFEPYLLSSYEFFLKYANDL